MPGQHVGVFAHCGQTVRVHQQVNEDDDRRDEGEKVNPACPPGEEISSALRCESGGAPASTTMPHGCCAKRVSKARALSVASRRTPIRADQVLIDCIGIVVGRRDGIDPDQSLGRDAVQQRIELVDIAGAQEDASSIGMQSGFDAMIDGKHLRRQHLGVIAANENLHRLFAHFLSDLMNISLGDQISAGDQDDAIGDAIDFVQNVAGDQQVHSLPASSSKSAIDSARAIGSSPFNGSSRTSTRGMVGDRLREPDLLAHALAVAGDPSLRRVAELHAFEGLLVSLTAIASLCRAASGYR